LLPKTPQFTPSDTRVGPGDHFEIVDRVLSTISEFRAPTGCITFSTEQFYHSKPIQGLQIRMATATLLACLKLYTIVNSGEDEMISIIVTKWENKDN
jgi:hypothetical protein